MTESVGVVFPQANLLGGVERVVWDLLNYLGDRRPTTFVGTTLLPTTSPNVVHRHVCPRAAPRSLRPLAFRRAAARAIGDQRPSHLVSFGAVCPPGDVLWVQSVHRAWLEQSSSVRVGPVAVPAQARFLMPWHRTLLALERHYFTHSSPRWVLCTSHREVDDLDRLYRVPRDRMVVIPNGYDGQRFNPAKRAAWRDAERKRLGLAEGDIALLFVANELHRKGFAQTLRAMAAAGDARMSLHVVGRMPLSGYAAEIRALGLENRVRYHGPSDEVERYHAAADALVLPTQYEPFGLVIIEAMASGLPVLTTSLAGAAEAITHGATGLLQQDPYDVDELTHLLGELAADDQRASIAAASPAAAASYEWQKVFGRAERYIFDT